MGLFGSSDPAVKEEKLINKEAKSEEKNLKHLVKEVAKAEKNEAKAAKGESHAHTSFEKAHKVETKLAGKLNQAAQKHDTAVSKEHAAQNDIKTHTEAHNHAQSVLEQKKAELNQIQNSHQQHEATRQHKLDELHRPAEAAGVAGVGAGAAGHHATGTHTGAPTTAQGGYTQNATGGQGVGAGVPGQGQGYEQVPGQGVGGQGVAGQPVYGGQGVPSQTATDGSQLKHAVQRM